MPKKVFHLITELYPGGAERIVLDLCSGLNRERFTPVAAALDGRGEYAEKLRAAGVKVYDLGAYSRRDFGVIWRLRKILREERVDLLHTHLIHSTFVGRLAARPLGVPVIMTSHIVDRRPVWWHFLLDRLTARWCKREICVSEAVRNFLITKTGLPENFFQVIYNGLGFSRFDNMKTPVEARALLGLPEGKITVGVLGRYDAQKGIDVFIEAVSRLVGKDEIDGLHFAIAGYGDEEEKLKILARERDFGDVLTFVGYVEAQDFFPAVDIAVCPSRWEGFGLVPLEAMYCGLPVIASNVDSLPEIIRKGTDGILVPPENPDALAEEISHLAADGALQEKLTTSARERAKSFSLKKMVESYEAVYESLL